MEDSAKSTRPVSETITLDREPYLKTVSYIKSIQRRGNTYTIRDSVPSEEEQLPSDGTDQMIQDLYSDAMSMSLSANRKASIFKLCNVLATIFMTIAGVVIGVLSLNNNQGAIGHYISSILGFVITAIQTLLSTFSIEKRSVLLKEVASKLRKVAREIKILQNSEKSTREKMLKLEEFYAEVDELDLSIFDSSITTVSIKNRVPLESDVSRSNGSDDRIRPKKDSDDKMKPKESLFDRLRSRNEVTVSPSNIV